MQNIIYTIRVHVWRTPLCLYYDSLKETITNCSLVGQTLSMSMEKQYTLGKYSSWQCTIEVAQSHSLYLITLISRHSHKLLLMILGGRNWFASLHCCMQPYSAHTALYLYIHNNQSITGRRKPCVDKMIAACLFEEGPEVCWSFEGELASLLSANF